MWQFILCNGMRTHGGCEPLRALPSLMSFLSLPAAHVCKLYVAYVSVCPLLACMLELLLIPDVLSLLDYRYLYNHCPGPEWNVMCRGCCEYDVIRCKCPLQGTPVGYAVPCCRNAINECDPCIIHPGRVHI